MTPAVALTSTRLPGLVVIALLGIVSLSVVAVALAALTAARAARRQSTLVANLEARVTALEGAGEPGAGLVSKAGSDDNRSARR